VTPDAGSSILPLGQIEYEATNIRLTRDLVGKVAAGKSSVARYSVASKLSAIGCDVHPRKSKCRA
jgi:hypothetical protein